MRARADTVLLGLLLAAAVAFITVHVVHVSTPYLSSPLHSLAREHGHAEFFQYVKEYWLVLLSAVLILRHRAFIHVAWLVVFAYFLADDVLSLHEAGGTYVARKLGITPVLGLRPQDVGEAVFLAVVGTAAAVLLALGYRLADAESRALSRRLFVLVVALLIVGVGVDVIEEAFDKTVIGMVLAVVEDGGEMIVMSFVVWTMVRAVARGDGATTPFASPFASPSPRKGRP